MKDRRRAALGFNAVPGLPPLPLKVWRMLEANADLPDDRFLAWVRESFDAKITVAVEERLQRWTEISAVLDDWRQSGIWRVDELTPSYPRLWIDRLGLARPAMLFGLGNQSLLNRRAIGVVGSRSASEQILQATVSMAKQAVDLDYAVCSGGARGVDQVAAMAALDAGGDAVVLCADRLQNVAKPFQTRSVDHWCAATAISPNSTFNVGNAMARNKLIYGLSKATIVMACDVETGGTWSGAVEALKAENGIVLVWLGEGALEGNRRLLEMGALGIRQPEALYEALLEGQAMQSSLFDDLN
jgi:predicted Rossmann fold nucleotide-binding protein DprA/Smf involved in DNA uptake